MSYDLLSSSAGSTYFFAIPDDAYTTSLSTLVEHHFEILIIHHSVDDLWRYGVGAACSLFLAPLELGDRRLIRHMKLELAQLGYRVTRGMMKHLLWDVVREGARELGNIVRSDLQQIALRRWFDAMEEWIEELAS